MSARRLHGAIAAGALLTLGTFVACSRRSAAPTPHPNILLITVDTLRADRVGAGVAPGLDRLAASSLRFTAARSAVPLTLPSHTTILTGLLPPAHGVRENGDVLDASHPTVAALLKNAGYRTAAFVGAFVLDRRFGLAHGFDTYDDRIPRDPRATERLEAERPASAVVDAALRWFGGSRAAGEATTDQRLATSNEPPVAREPQSSTDGQQPFFVWVHLYDPHAPYTPPEEFRARAKTPYDGEVAYADAEIARLFDHLRRTPAPASCSSGSAVLDCTLVIVAGDHGEGLGDHGERTHGMLLYDSTLRVPLILSMPGIAAGHIDEPVSLAELAPTILRAASVTPPDAMKGRNLLDGVRLKPDTTELRLKPDTTELRLKPDTTELRLKPDTTYNAQSALNTTSNTQRATNIANNTAPDVRSVRLQPDLYSETLYPRAAGWSPLQALADERWKAISAGNATELYDLQHDPQESRDVAASQTSVAAAMASRLAAIGSTAAASANPASADAQERLRALGYVTSSSQPAAPADTGGAADNGSARRTRSPANDIASWNAFEDALSALNAGRGEALPSLQKLAASHPNAPVFQATYARALKQAGRADEAVALYRTAAHRWPTDGVLLHDFAVAARDAAGASTAPTKRRALLDEALRAEQAAVAVAPASATAHNGLGLLAIDEGRPRDAAAEFDRATVLDPDNASYWANLGNARRALGDRAGAEHAYRTALGVDGRSADAANGLGVLLVEADRPADAVPLFEQALAAAPDLVEARLNLGIALQQAGRVDAAANEYRRILAAPPRFARERDAAQKLLASMGAPQR